MEKDGRLVSRAPAPQLPDRNHPLQSNQIAQVIDATPEQLDSIKKYQVWFWFINFYLAFLKIYKSVFGYYSYSYDVFIIY